MTAGVMKQKYKVGDLVRMIKHIRGYGRVIDVYEGFRGYIYYVEIILFHSSELKHSWYPIGQFHYYGRELKPATKDEIRIAML